MSTKATDETKPNSSQEDGGEENEGGLVPAIIAGAGILAVVALLVFWPSSEDGKDGGGKDGSAAAAANGAGGRGGANGAGGGAKGAGGIGARSADDPDRSGAVAAGPRRNPAIPPLEGMGLAPAVPPEEPPKFKTVDQEIRWYEKQLVSASSDLETRTRAKERIVKLKNDAKNSDDAEARLARVNAREKLVNENFDRAEAKVAEIEAKLAELRGKSEEE